MKTNRRSAGEHTRCAKMTFCESMKYHCCTYEGLNKFKKLLASGVGVAIFVVALVSLINPALWANVYSQIRQMWNLLFGLLMIFMQLGWEKWIGQRFGFLNGWFGRGMFFLFVGTNIMCAAARARCPLAPPREGARRRGRCGAAECWYTWLVGGCSIFVGVVELMFGFRCKAEDEDTDMKNRAQIQDNSQPEQPKKSGWFGGGGGGGGGTINTAQEPSFTINVNPSQVAAGAKFAADNAGTISKVAGAAAEASASGAKGSDNPFFGNSHLQ